MQSIRGFGNYFLSKLPGSSQTPEAATRSRSETNVDQNAQPILNQGSEPSALSSSANLQNRVSRDPGSNPTTNKTKSSALRRFGSFFGSIGRQVGKLYSNTIGGPTADDRVGLDKDLPREMQYIKRSVGGPPRRVPEQLYFKADAKSFPSLTEQEQEGELYFVIDKVVVRQMAKDFGLSKSERKAFAEDPMKQAGIAKALLGGKEQATKEDIELKIQSWREGGVHSFVQDALFGRLDAKEIGNRVVQEELTSEQLAFMKEVMLQGGSDAITSLCQLVRQGLDEMSSESKVDPREELDHQRTSEHAQDVPGIPGRVSEQFIKDARRATVIDDLNTSQYLVDNPADGNRQLAEFTLFREIFSSLRQRLSTLENISEENKNETVHIAFMAMTQTFDAIDQGALLSALKVVGTPNDWFPSQDPDEVNQVSTRLGEDNMLCVKVTGFCVLKDSDSKTVPGLKFSYTREHVINPSTREVRQLPTLYARIGEASL